MWISTNKGFISIVRDRQNDDALLVRARRKQHLEEIFPEFKSSIIETRHADYRWRVFIKEKDVMVIIARQISLIDYDNFKNSVRDEDLHDAYSEVWSVMYGLQRQTSPQTGVGW
jgi:ASC-1-like (ASCH) protein